MLYKVLNISVENVLCDIKWHCMFPLNHKTFSAERQEDVYTGHSPKCSFTHFSDVMQNIKVFMRCCVLNYMKVMNTLVH